MNYMTVKRNNNRNLDVWKDFDRVFDSFFHGENSLQEARTPVTNIKEIDNGFELTAELPGFGAEDLDIQVDENILKISASHKEDRKEKKKEAVREEHREIKFEKTFILPQDINKDKIQADMKNGLLRMVLPKQPKPEPISIKVKG